MQKKTLSDEEVAAFQKLNEEALAFRSNGKGRKLSILVAVLFLLVLCFFWTPALNPQDTTLYKTLGIALTVYCLMRVATSGFYQPSRNIIQTVRFLFREERIASVALIALLVLCAGGMLVSSPLFFSKQYQQLLNVTDGDFIEEVDSISIDRIPTIDSASVAQLGNRALGELSDLVSQFEVESAYTQINLDNTPVSIASLQYGNLFKWLANRQDGLPGYVVVDMLTQDAVVTRVEGGLRYSDSEPFLRNIQRYLRLHYPTYLFDECHLEIDESGQPWWICPRLVRRIALFGGTDVAGAVLVQATTGETIYYAAEDLPSWVDQLYSAELIAQQYDWYGKYANGFFNSLLSQTGVTRTTEGANYIALDDDIYLYSGITSSGADQSNVGFILCNLRTKDAAYYSISGATEQSAQSSAEGAVQHLSYTATFPLLLNIYDQPTYFMALKDSASLVKMYAMVNVGQYQLVAVGATIAACQENYIQLLQENGIAGQEVSSVPDALLEVSGVVTDLRENVVEGTTFYYIQLDGAGSYYRISASELPGAVLLDENCSVRLSYEDTGDQFREVRSLTLQP